MHATKNANFFSLPSIWVKPADSIDNDPHTHSQSLYFRYHILVILVCRIFFCNWNMPYIRASAVGGPIDQMSARTSTQSQESFGKNSQPGT